MDPKLLSLAPTDALDPQKDQDFKAYNDHLSAVFSDGSLRNIAMIGNRGSGKSSILRSLTESILKGPTPVHNIGACKTHTHFLKLRKRGSVLIYRDTASFLWV